MQFYIIQNYFFAEYLEQTLLDAFLPYGFCHVEWPNGNNRGMSAVRHTLRATGYVYIVFESEQSVRVLLQDCGRTYGNAGELYFRLKTRRSRAADFRQAI